MERKKCITTLIAILFVFQMFANVKREIYNAYISNNMNEWKYWMDAVAAKDSLTINERIDLLNFQYGYIGWCLGNDEDDLAEEYLEKAEKNLLYLEKNSLSQSDFYSYRAAFYGYRIGISILYAPVLGPESISAAETALKLNSSNWFAYVQNANIEFYMPKMFGGSKEKALQYYLKAEQLLASSNFREIQYNWNYLNTLVLIAQTYSEIGNYALAENYYKKILLIEPNFTWVKNELYPRLLERN